VRVEPATRLFLDTELTVDTSLGTALTMTLLGAPGRTAEQQQELREARRIFRERIKHDWYYPPLPAYQKSPPQSEHQPGTEDEEAKVAGFRFHSTAITKDVDVEIVQWRERTYSTDSESDGESVKTDDSLSSRKSKRSEYRFDRPDSVGPQIESRRLARKRKRQRQMEEETGWNDGLKHWISQRDTWTGARSTSEPTTSHGEQPSQDQDPEAGTDSANSTSSTPRTSTSSTAEVPSSTSTTPDPVLPIRLSQPVPPAYSPTPPQADVLLPVCAQIMPNHPVRKRITPSMYSEIYSKIIVSSRTPSVPINLATLVAALIEGWKADGEWPPKGGPLEPSIGRRKHRAGHGGESLKNGVKAVARTLRLTGTSETSSQAARDKG
jgi:hypothetical protein